MPRFSPAPSSFRTLPQAEREFFQRALNARIFTTGQLPAHLSRTAPAIAFAQPMFDESGQLEGLVFATLDVTWTSRHWSELPSQLPRTATWTEVDRNGTILMRHPAPERWVGQPFPNPALLKTAFEMHSGLIEQEDSAEVPSFYAINSLHSQFRPAT